MRTMQGGDANPTFALTRAGGFGPVRPVLVFEIAFEGIQPSTRHKSGVAVRFPRIHRWRRYKKVENANTLNSLKALLPD